MAAVTRRAEELHRRQGCGPGRGRDGGRGESGYRLGDRLGAAVDQGRRRRRGRRGEGGVRGLGGDAAGRTGAGALADRRPDRGARRGDRRPRGRRRRQAARRGARGRGAGDGRQPALLRRRRPLHGGSRRRRVHGGPHLLRPPRAGRRGRPDHPLELPADDGDLEDRPGARGRQHGRPQAGRDDAADHPAVRRVVRRPPAAGRAQRDRRPRRADRASSWSTIPTSRWSA